MPHGLALIEPLHEEVIKNKSNVTKLVGAF